MDSASVEDLLLEAQPQRARELDRRELTVEWALCLLVLAAATVWPLVAGIGAVDWTTAALCVVAYATTASVVLYVGAGCALATQLAFVPMLWTLPAAIVPLCVVAGLGLWTLADMLIRRHHMERLLTAVGNAGYAFAPAAVFALLPRGWGTVLVALVAQCVFDSVLSIAREWLSRGIAPRVQLAVMGSVYGVDALLLPVAVAIAQQAAQRPLAILAVVPLSALLAAFAHDRAKRIGESMDQLAELQRERERVDVAIHRVGRSLGAGHDRVVVLEVALGTAVDAVAAAAGRARLIGLPRELIFEALPPRDGALRAAELADAERAALAGRSVDASEGDRHALGRPLLIRRDSEQVVIGTMVVGRTGAPFSTADEALFSYLVAQTAASIQSIDLHDRLRSEISLDAQTGLANRARFRDLLGAELALADTTGGPLTLLAVGLDHVDQYERELGDAIVRAAGEALRDRSRVVDEPARLRSDRFGLVLAGATADAARMVGDDIRASIAAIELRWREATVRPSASIGIAARSPDCATREALLQAAEHALGRAQRAGGDRTVVFAGEARSLSGTPPEGAP